LKHYTSSSPGKKTRFATIWRLRTVILLQLIVAGVSLGILYGLIGVSWGLVLQVTGLFHFAHASVITAAGYTTWVVAERLGAPLLVAATAGILVAVILGILIHFVIYRPLLKLQANPVVILIASLGVLTIFEAVFMLSFTSLARVVSGFPRRMLTLVGIPISSVQLVMILVSLAFISLLIGFLYRTKKGKMMRAVADNPELAEIIGISKSSTYMLTFGIASVLGGVGGFFYLLNYGVSPAIGVEALTMGFIAVIMGGVQNMGGILLSGVVIGLAMHVGVWKIPSQWMYCMAYGFAVLALILFPHGLWRKK
jgi:branched-chain amino acid transport system permease protein